MASVTGLAAAAGETGIGGQPDCADCTPGRHDKQYLSHPLCNFMPNSAPNNFDQTKETKKIEKKNLYLFVSQARNIHPVIHLSCLILNRIK